MHKFKLICAFSDVEHLQWVHTPKDADIAIDASLQWECKAMGNPRPAYKWLKNGQMLTEEVRTVRIKRRKKFCISLLDQSFSIFWYLHQ